MATNNIRIYELKAYRELRIVTLEKTNILEENKECIKIRILSNQHISKNESKKNIATAEIFGQELLINKDYYFGYNQKFAIFTYTGCTIQIKGKTLQEYQTKNHSIKYFLSLAYILDAYRKLAKKKKTIGPRVLITGNKNSGKSTVSLLLSNYARKSGFKPLYIETDPKCTCDKIELNRGPGIMSCFFFMENMFSLDYFFGYCDINEDIDLYYHLNECLSNSVYLMLLNNYINKDNYVLSNVNNDLICSSGFLLNVPSEADNKTIEKLIDIYNINVVLIIDNSFLHHSLQDYFNNMESENDNNNDQNNLKKKKKIEIIGLPKFEGVIPSDNNRLNYCKNLWFYEYFSKDIIQNNIDKKVYKKSHIINFKYSETNFVKLDTNSTVPLSALPADFKNVKIETVNVSYYNDIKNLVNTILGISYSKDFSYVHIMNIAGFAYVQNIKEIKIPINETSILNDINESNPFNITNLSNDINQNGNENNEKQNQEYKIDYLIEILCPIFITPKNIPPYFIVPGNIRHVKF